MNTRKYKRILYVIIAVIIANICIQSYWNYNNYLNNKQQVFNDIQWSLDNAIEAYYAELSKNNFLTLVNTNDSDNKAITRDSLLKPLDLKLKQDEIDTLKRELKLKTISIIGDSIFESDSLYKSIFDTMEFNLDSVKHIKINKFTQLSKDKKTGLTFDKNSKKATQNKVFWGEKARDSLKLIKGISTIFIAMQQDSINYKKLDTLINIELKNKGINSSFYLNHFKNKSLIFSSKTKTQEDYDLKKLAKSTYLRTNESVSLNFKNPVLETFKRSYFGILLSSLLILAVISCLLYLLKIIKHQKQLAEVKNDLISNITHEFKTPIATIGVALESINSFNGINDKEKTKKYINMSSDQLGKLNIMVEKLLETATLDSESLELNIESIDLVEFLTALTNRYKIQFPEKVFNTSFKVENLYTNVDVFHFENALNNIIDNAVKYGGNIISIDLIPKDKSFDILISDDGNTLSKANKNRVFEKFYRVPKGNTHDVKGFGIGLYYTKTILEKHKGSIDLELSKDLTTFKITLPNG